MGVSSFHLPGLKRLRLILQLATLLLAAVLIYDGLFGPKLPPKNIAGVLGWVHYRGVLIVALLAFGNLFCLSCPMMAMRNLVRKFISPTWRWPRFLRSKWPAIVLFIAFLYTYEAYSLWESPRLTALVALAYFILAIAIDSLFQGSSFCKYVCPIGQFNFVSSTCSPFEIAAKDLSVCASCQTKDCINGRKENNKVIARGCERDLFLPRKVGNLDCTFCLDCVFACPYENVALKSRIPGSELWQDPLRSGIGRLSRRSDFGILAMVFTFGALLNIFGMVSPIYSFQTWLGVTFEITNRLTLLAVIATLFLIIEPVLLLGGTAWLIKRFTQSEMSLSYHALQVAFTLIPLGLGVWTAHYLFHFLTGLFTLIPTVQYFFTRHGVNFLGDPMWQLSGIQERFVTPFEFGFIGLGLVGTLLVTAKIYQRTLPHNFLKGFAPTAFLAILISVAAFWLMNQPMEMRGTLFAP